ASTAAKWTLHFLVQHRFADNFFDRGMTAEDGPEAALAEADHALLDAGGTQFVSGGAFGNQVANLVVDQEQLEDAQATVVSGVVATIAAAAVEDLLALHVLGPHVQLHQHLRRRLEFGAAVFANLAHQPLGKNALDRGGDEERLDAHVAQARDAAGRVVG